MQSSYLIPLNHLNEPYCSLVGGTFQSRRLSDVCPPKNTQETKMKYTSVYNYIKKTHGRRTLFYPPGRPNWIPFSFDQKSDPNVKLISISHAMFLKKRVLDKHLKNMRECMFFLICNRLLTIFHHGCVLFYNCIAKLFNYPEGKLDSVWFYNQTHQRWINAIMKPVTI